MVCHRLNQVVFIVQLLRERLSQLAPERAARERLASRRKDAFLLLAIFATSIILGRPLSRGFWRLVAIVLVWMGVKGVGAGRGRWTRGCRTKECLNFILVVLVLVLGITGLLVAFAQLTIQA